MRYRVKPGDTMGKIAKRFKVDLDALIAANPQIKDPNQIFPNDIIIIPGANEHGMVEIPEVSAPYPEIKVEKPNQAYADLLREDYAGRVSEITAISQYVYHHLQMEETPGWAEVAKLEEGISIVEMHHMEMLGETILKLGGDPKYQDETGNYWQGNFVAYHSRDLCRQLQADIAAEKAAIQQYRSHIQQIADSHVQAILERIILDEQLHLKLFSEAWEKHCN